MVFIMVGFLDKSKYKLFENDKNVIVGQAELSYIPHLNGWATLGGGVIYNKQDAIKYAQRLDIIITFNLRRINKSRARQL